MLTFEGFTGINNQVPAHRLKGSDLVSANDVDIGLTGEILRRGGYAKTDTDCHKNVHQSAGYKLATVESDLTAIHPNGDRHIIYESLGMSRVWYTDLPDGRTTFSNGLINGITDGLTGKAWSVPVPASLGVARAIAGSMFPGSYTYHLTFRRSDGAESPATSAGALQIDTGGIYLSGLPMLEGHTLQVYLSRPNGEVAYLAGSTTNDEFQYTGPSTDLILPCHTIGTVPMPIGTISAFWRGRLLVAQGRVLWASRPMAPHLAEWRDFRPMPADITAIQPMDGGIYVGTEDDLIWLGGETFDQLAYVPTKRGPVVLGSGVAAPGDQIKLGDGTGVGNAMLCIAGGEIVAGFNGGQTTSLTGNRYKTTATEVCATFRVLNGIPQYLAVPQ